MIQLGSQAPDFSNVTSYCKGCSIPFPTTSLSEFRGKWLVFFFYPRDFKFICPNELKRFNSARSEFEKMNAKVLAASTDSAWSHKAWFERDMPEVCYPILADTNLGVENLRVHLFKF